ncbi:hypothetical protein ACVWY0_004310 [Arthrobacter sp. UYNi723]
MMSNPVEQWQLQEVMSERASAPETDIEAALNWEIDPEAWKEPHAAAPHMTSLVQNFEELYEGKSLLDGLKTPLSEADPEFLDLVKAYWAQMKRDHSPLLPLTADAHELHRLSAKDMAVSLDRMNEIMRTVFDWMISQGKQPVPGWTTWKVGLPPELEELLED